MLVVGNTPYQINSLIRVRSQTMLCSVVVVSLRTEVNTNFPNVPLVVTIEQTTDLVNCIVTAAAAPAQYNTCRRSVQLDDLSWKLLRVLATRGGEQYEWFVESHSSEDETRRMLELVSGPGHCG